MRKKAIVYSLILLVIVFIIVMCSNPLYRSEEQIRAYMLKRTPIGTEMEDVIKVIEKNKKWEIDYVSNEYGYSLQGGYPDSYFPGMRSYDEELILGNVIGKQSIRVYIGEYKAVFSTGVIVFFGFDENSKLVNLHVRKDIDAL